MKLINREKSNGRPKSSSLGIELQCRAGGGGGEESTICQGKKRVIILRVGQVAKKTGNATS